MSRRLSILLTGFTSRQANTISDRANIYITTSPLLKGMLEKIGHAVDWRPVVFGEEDVSKYDLVMVGCSDPNSYTGMVHRYGAYWALLKAKRLMIWFDDWRIKGQYHAWLEKADTIWQTRMMDPNRMDEHAQALRYKEAIDNVVTSLATTDKAAVMAQLFNWGYEEQFMREVPHAKWLARFDISSLVPKVLAAPARPLAERNRGWVAASLTQVDDWTDKLPLRYPLVTQAKPKGMRGGGWKKLHEVQLVNTLYAENTGILCKPYSHAGSGWWRSRFNYAVETRSVLYGDPKEIHAIGDAYRHSLPELENMSIDQLQRVANEQMSQFIAWQDTPQMAMDKLDGYLVRIMDEPTRPQF